MREIKATTPLLPPLGLPNDEITRRVNAMAKMIRDHESNPIVCLLATVASVVVLRRDANVSVDNCVQLLVQIDDESEMQGRPSVRT